MYCRMCGNQIGDTDHYCQYCGSPTRYKEQPTVAAAETDGKEEVVFNPPFENTSHITEDEEDLTEFISENEIEKEQKKEEDEDKEERSEPVKNSEFTWNVYEFPTVNKKTENIEFNWKMEEYSQQEQKEAEAATFEEELFQEIRDDSNRIKEQNIDRFFTFSRKNEEFQELLDREYERFKMRSGPAPVTDQEITNEEAELQEVHTDSDIPAEAQYEETPLDTEVPADMEEQEEIPEEEPAEKQEEPDEEPIEELAEEPEEEPVSEEKPILAEEPIHPEPPKSEHITEMSLARAQFFGEDLICDNESIRRKLTFGEALYQPPDEETPETETAETEEPLTEAEAAPLATPIFKSGAMPEQGEEKQKKSVGQIVLTVIAVILVIEITILGIRYFAPESSAAKAIGNAQTEIFNTVSGWFDGDSQGNSEQNPDENAPQVDLPDEEQPDEEQPADTEDKPAPDPNPIADKNALVTSQMGNNINIEQVKANPVLAYQQGKNYGQTDINNSKPITNNIWQTPETGEPVYYDKSIVGTIIAFDSQWIDYVNGGSKTVLDLLKKDSKAYLNAVNYSKIGKIEETFKLLEIGEIRQGSKGFYIWAHEEIQITEKGKTVNQKYNWIYYLEPANGKMQIVNYYHF